MTEVERPAVLSVLAETYRRIGVALQTALADTVFDPNGPYKRWRDVDLPESEFLPRGPEWLPADHVPRAHPLHVLAQAGELAAVSALGTLRAHLAMLARAYWPDLHDPTDPVIAHPAIYPPARSVLEGVGEACWLLNPYLSLHERARRAADLLLWAQVSRRGAASEWQDVARAAGFEVKGTRTRPESYSVWTDGRPDPLTLGRMIRAALGEDCANLYSDWSGSTHPDPMELSVRPVLTWQDSGVTHIRYVREDLDVVVAANVASLVAEAIECQADYWARSAAPAEEVRAIAAELAGWAPVVAELVNARNHPGGRRRPE